MIGFDIGGTKCAVCVGVEKDGELIILDKRVLSTDPSILPYEIIDRLCDLTEEMTAAQADKTGDESLRKIDCIGISCGGPLDSQRGIILSPPNLPGWDDLEIVSYLKKRYNAKVSLQNDANACAVAEWKFGAGKGTKNMVFLTFGSGMGAGLILNGQLYAGSSEMAGEVGHVRMSDYGPVGYGKAGSFEGFCSGNGLAQIGQMIAREKLQVGEKVSYCAGMDKLEKITAKSIMECANQGHEDAVCVYRICGEMLGKGLSLLIDILNPECIVLGSVYQRSGHLLKESMQKVIERETLQTARNVCKVVPTLLGDNIGDYAALAVASMGKFE